MIASDDEEVKVLLILYKDNKKDILLVADPLPGYLEMILGLFEGSEGLRNSFKTADFIIIIIIRHNDTPRTPQILFMLEDSCHCNVRRFFLIQADTKHWVIGIIAQWLRC